MHDESPRPRPGPGLRRRRPPWRCPAAAQGLRPAPQLGAPAGRAARRQRARARPTSSWRWSIPSRSPTTKCARAWLRFEQQLAQQGAPCRRAPSWRAQVLERLISEKAQLQLARETGIRSTRRWSTRPSRTSRGRTRSTWPNCAGAWRPTASTLAQFREDLRNQLLLQRLRDRELEPRVKVTDLDIDQFLREQQGGNDAAPHGDQPGAHPGGGARERHARRRCAQLQAKAQRRAGARPRRRGLRQAGARDLRRARRRRQRRPGRPAHRRPLSAAVRRGDAATAAKAASATSVRSGAGFHVLKVVEKRQGGLPGIDVDAEPCAPHPAAPRRRS